MSFGSKRKKFTRFTKENLSDIDYKNVNLLLNFVTETGKIVPNRITGISARAQRELARAIRVARQLALLPFCDSHK